MFRRLLHLLLLYCLYAQAQEQPGPLTGASQEFWRSVDGLNDAFQAGFPLSPEYILPKRAEGIPIENNKPKSLNLVIGQPQCYVAQKGTFGQEKDSRKTLYISANACEIPHYVGKEKEAPIPPNLILSVTNSSTVGCPQPSAQQTNVTRVAFDGGAAMLQLNATDDVFITISAEDPGTDFQGIYAYEVAVSTDMFYHAYEKPRPDELKELLWLDSDSGSSLLVSRNLTTDSEQSATILKEQPPYDVYINPGNDTRIWGMRYSACGLDLNANIKDTKRADSTVHTDLTTRGPGGFPKQEFYITGLNASANYTGFLVKRLTNSGKRDGEPGGGGTVFNPTSFTTTSSMCNQCTPQHYMLAPILIAVLGANCKLAVGLEFCDQIQYAVPGNPFNFTNTAALIKAYDNYAKEMYSNFEKVMMQIQCETTSTEKYSLARNCDDCRAAYKKWLCTVSMPRCEDVTSMNPNAVLRNAGQKFPDGTMDSAIVDAGLRNPAFNASRNSFIDTVIRPGPYKEILPCEEICYEVVQSCPAKIGFVCPRPHMPAFDSSYAKRDPAVPLSCNSPGEPRTPINSGSALHPWSAVMIAIYAILLGYYVMD